MPKVVIPTDGSPAYEIKEPGTIKPEELSSEALSLLNTYAQSQPHLFQMCLRDWIRSVESRLAAPAPPQEAATGFCEDYGQCYDADCNHLPQEAAPVEWAKCPNCGALDLPFDGRHYERWVRIGKEVVPDYTCTKAPAPAKVETGQKVEITAHPVALAAQMLRNESASQSSYADRKDLREAADYLEAWGSSLPYPIPAPGKVETGRELPLAVQVALEALRHQRKSGAADGLERWARSLPAAPPEPKLEVPVEAIRLCLIWAGRFSESDEANKEVRAWLDALEAK